MEISCFISQKINQFWKLPYRLLSAPAGVWRFLAKDVGTRPKPQKGQGLVLRVMYDVETESLYASRMIDANGVL